MKVEIKISPEIEEPFAVIYSSSMTDEVAAIASSLNSSETIITASDNGRIVVLKPKEIFMVRVENEKAIIYCQTKKYLSGKPLYEMEALLGKEFMRISKSTLINLKEISCIDPSFNGIMQLELSNGSKDYISRKYLPNLKKYLGL